MARPWGTREGVLLGARGQVWECVSWGCGLWPLVKSGLGLMKGGQGGELGPGGGSSVQEGGPLGRVQLQMLLEPLAHRPSRPPAPSCSGRRSRGLGRQQRGLRLRSCPLPGTALEGSAVKTAQPRAACRAKGGRKGQ